MPTDEPAKFIVNTSKAGSGALSVTVDGPSKVKLDCRQVAEGHEFTYTPTVPGDYLVVIKFGGNTHIPASPFRARITGILQLYIAHLFIGNVSFISFIGECLLQCW